MSRPPPAGPGSRVRIVSPSGAVDRERFEPGIRLIQEAGYDVDHADDHLRRDRYLAGDDDRRLEELVAAFTDADVDVVWAARGGYGITRLLPRLEDEVLRGPPRHVVGFSDVTALHARLVRVGRTGLHGANVTTLAAWTDAAREELLACLRGEAPPDLEGRWLLGEGPVEGRLVGGNLTVLAALVGTPYLPPLDGAVVLLEDVDERPYRLDRTLTQLRQAGVLAGAAAVALGQLTRCEGCGWDEDADPEATVLEGLAPLGLPVLGRLPLGHEPTARPAVLGETVVLECEAGGRGTMRPA